MLATLVDAHVTVMGLGHFGGGIGAVRWLAGQGAKVIVTDVKSPEQLSDGLHAIADLVDRGLVQLALGGHQEAHFADADLIVASPAVPVDNPYLKLARGCGVAVSTELQLLIERLPPGITTVGITGSNGKSTTTALIAHLLEAGLGEPNWPFREVWLGGNIGISLLEKLPDMSADDVLVLELSSFMLEAFNANGLRWSPTVAVVTNLTANHLDRHKTMDAYGYAKQGILRHQRNDDCCVLNLDDLTVREWGGHSDGQPLYFSTQPEQPAHDGQAVFGPATVSLEARLKLPGQHNLSNAYAAWAAAAVAIGYRQPGAMPEPFTGPMLDALTQFPGLPHRLEFVAELPPGRDPLRDPVHPADEPVRYYNDSKATTPESAIIALDSFPRGRIVAIVGGSDKGSDFSQLVATLHERAHTVVIIGQVRDKLAQLLSDHAIRTGNPGPAVEVCDQFPDAVRVAKHATWPGDVVVLSPGCASYGMFAHYEDRGEQFKTLVLGDPAAINASAEVVSSPVP